MFLDKDFTLPAACETNYKTRNFLLDGKTYSVPAAWSNTAAKIAITKYFGPNETSVYELLSRVSGKISLWGEAEGYFSSNGAQAFHQALLHIMWNQLGCLNSPALINLGLSNRLQTGSACYILDVNDDLSSILDLARKEALIFKSGAGVGVNFSKLRPKNASLSGGGSSSGPLSFMKALDTMAGAVKSGGRARRAARLSVLDVDHPDIFDFIKCKGVEEEKARDLMNAGWSSGLDGEATQTVAYQNSNHSVRITDSFMRQALSDTKGKEALILSNIAQAAWETGDPGVIFKDALLRANPCSISINDIHVNACQPGFATVLTPQGITTFDNLRVGDTIWSGKRWTHVINKIHTGNKPVFKYQTTAGFFVGTQDHKIVQDGAKIAAANALSIDTSVGPASESPTGEYSERDKTLIMDGLVLGDGTVHRASNNLVLLCIGENDRDYFDSEIAKLITCARPGVHDSAHEIETNITFYELPYTFERKVPARYMLMPSRDTAMFLRGLFSANGTVNEYRRIAFRTSSSDMRDDVQLLLSSIGIGSYFTTTKPQTIQFPNGEYTTKQSYEVTIGPDREKFYRLVGFIQKYKTERLERVVKSSRSGKKKLSYKIGNKTFIGNLPVFDITVDAPEHTYWTGGLLVSNCAEVTLPANSSCNLASINLQKVFKLNDVEGSFYLLCFVTKILIIALDIIASCSDFPIQDIYNYTRKYRPLGLGITGLGALIMQEGLAYNSEDGRTLAKTLMEEITWQAWWTSLLLSEHLGTSIPVEDLPGFIDALSAFISPAPDNVSNCVLRKIKSGNLPRNMTTTAIAPTGTISLMMDAESTGIEPLFGLQTSKETVDGDIIKTEPQCVEEALQRLSKVNPGVSREELLKKPCFYTAMNGLTPEDHLAMVANVLPYVSMNISKTINLPTSATIQDTSNVFAKAWELGLKSVTVYRDGSKVYQPLKTKTPIEKILETAVNESVPVRKRLPNERQAIVKKFKLGGKTGYLTAGVYENGSLGEIFIEMDGEGTTLGGLLNSLSIVTSIAIQYGVPIEAIAKKMMRQNFEPRGFTGDEEIRTANSVVDFVFRWLLLHFKKSNGGAESPLGSNPSRFGVYSLDVNGNGISHEDPDTISFQIPETSDFICSACGCSMLMSGTCHLCPLCGTTSGGCS